MSNQILLSNMKYRIAVFPGDGVGPELMNEGVKLIDKAAELDKFVVEWVKYPHGSEHYLETKEKLPEKSLKEIKNSCSAVYCGTFDNIKSEASIEKSISSAIRHYFDQFVSLRPIKLLPSVESPLAGKTNNEINFTIIRENTEDFYIGVGGKQNGKSVNQTETGKNPYKIKFVSEKMNDVAYQVGILSKKGCERFIKYAF